MPKSLLSTLSNLLLSHLLPPLHPHLLWSLSYWFLFAHFIQTCQIYIQLRALALVILGFKNPSSKCLPGLLSHILSVFTWFSLSHWGFHWPLHRMILQTPTSNIHIFLSTFLLCIPSGCFCITCYDFYLIILLLVCYWNVSSKKGVIFIWFIH